MAYAVIDNGVVANVVEATPEFAAEQGWKLLKGGAGIGWSFHAGINTFSPPDTVEPTLPDLAPYQFRAMLALSGKQADLESYIDALPEPNKTIARAKLEFSLVFKYGNDLVQAARAALQMPEADFKALWLQAAAIQ